MVFRSVAEFGSKEWANDQLKFAILVLKGQCGGKRWKGNLQMALIIKERLEEKGFTWQAERIENWIHRLQPRKADSPQKGGGGERLHSAGILPYAKSRLSKSEVSPP